MNSKNSLLKTYWAILALAAGYVLVALFFSLYLHYDFMRADVAWYWQDSLKWQTPFNQYHVPLYPFIIALFRGITLGILPPILLMMGINLAAFLGSAFVIHRIFNIIKVNTKLAAMGILLFGLWPCVGLIYTVDPLSDMPAMFLFLVGLYCLLKERRNVAAVSFGFSMTAHKVMWFFVGAIILFDFIKRREFFSKKNIVFILITLLPIGILWFAGAIYYGKLTWLFASSINIENSLQTRYPILDGLIGTFREGGIKGMSKGVLLSGFACISAITIFAILRNSYKKNEYWLGISIVVMALFLLINHYEIWSAMRFGRLLAVPLMIIANYSIKFQTKKWLCSTAAISSIAILFLSQFAYAWYLARIFYGY
jgi:hypothetical protein